MLYDLERHKKIPAVQWSEETAKDFVSNLFNSTETSFVPQQYWNKHSSETADDSMYEFHLYGGLAGIVWSQKVFEQNGYGIVKNDYRKALRIAKERQLADLEKEINCDNSDEYAVCLLIAELGFLITELKLSSDDLLYADLHTLVSRNTSNTVCEYMWGTAGLIAASMHFVNAKPKLISSIKNSVLALEKQLITSPTINIRVWKQNLYGHEVCHLGAIHGFAGNAFAIIKSFPLMEEEEEKTWSSLIRETIKQSAKRERNAANWPQSIDGHRPGRDQLIVQFCHGAPGIVCCLSSLMYEGDTQFDELMLDAGELIWRAGPLAKGANLCHGTAGNGFAFLKLFEATQDELWLSRARHFSMSAIHQVEEGKIKNNEYHYSLWSGDTGVGHFVDSCLRGNASIPTMDYF